MNSIGPVAVLSGGLDSATALALMVSKGVRPSVALTFDYGQRHRREIESARAVAAWYGIEHHVVDLTSVSHLISASALTSNVAVPEGHYAEESMRATVVPNRNAMMFAVAWGVAVSRQASGIVVGVHAGDHHIYPDCRPEFIASFEAAMVRANEGMAPDGMVVHAPLLLLDKAAIVGEASRLGVPMHLTWTCYNGRDKACGKCGSCVERLEAFALNDLVDPAEYE